MRVCLLKKTFDCILILEMKRNSLAWVRNSFALREARQCSRPRWTRWHRVAVTARIKTAFSQLLMEMSRSWVSLTVMANKAISFHLRLWVLCLTTWGIETTFSEPRGYSQPHLRKLKEKLKRLSSTLIWLLDKISCFSVSSGNFRRKKKSVKEKSKRKSTRRYKQEKPKKNKY